MWKEQTPRQVYELYKTYRDLHRKEDEPVASSSDSGFSSTTYETVGNPSIPEWLKHRIPKGATVYNADTVTQDQMMSNH
jgi:hypothetical protein